MQRPPAAGTSTRPPQQSTPSKQPITSSATASTAPSSSPFASSAAQRPFLPPGMNIGQTASSTAGTGNGIGPTSGMGIGLPGGLAGRLGFPPGNLPGAAGRPLGQSSPGLGQFGGRGASGGAFGMGVFSQGQPQPNIDLNDFPALGAQGSGQGGLGGPLAGSRTVSGATTGAPNGAFTSDDFPALGAQSAGSNPHFTNGSAAVVAAAAAAAAEQASAAAALQHQASQRDAHRLGVGNTINGSPQSLNRGSSPQTSSLNAARGGFGDIDRNYAVKLGSSQPSGLPALSTSSGSAQSWSHTNDGSLANGVSRPSNLSSTTTPASQILYSPADRFGLAGLLRIIKLQAGGPGAGGSHAANPEDVGMLALGNDLQSLGLDVANDKPLHLNFHTPWSTDANPLLRSQRAMVEPEWHLPSCYNVQPPPPAQTKLAHFTEETLFFIFYSSPRDTLQEMAALELYRRNWRFHKEMQKWLTKEPNMEPEQKTPLYEKGQYVFWEVDVWARVTKDCVLLYEALEDRPAAQIAQLTAAAIASGAIRDPNVANNAQTSSSGGDQSYTGDELSSSADSTGLGGAPPAAAPGAATTTGTPVASAGR